MEDHVSQARLTDSASRVFCFCTRRFTLNVDLSTFLLRLNLIDVNVYISRLIS